MQIAICPVKQLYRYLSAGEVAGCCAIISTSTAIPAHKVPGIPCLILQYDDVDAPLPGRSFSRADARAIAAFLQTLPDAIDTLYCCCDAGESRSPAVAAAICRSLGQDDMPIWQNPHYHPNMLVFDILADCLGVPVSDPEKDDRIYQNRKVFSDAIKTVDNICSPCYHTNRKKGSVSHENHRYHTIYRLPGYYGPTH